jgi:hypothetical protein
VAAAGCGSTGEKVLQDFGIKDRPEDYQSGADKVMGNLDNVGKVEMDRMNTASRRGQILYDKGDGLTTGAYYKRTKVYENYHPLDAAASSKTNRNDPLSFVGYIEYNFRYYESPRKPTRVEAEAQNADIPSGNEGSETYRYRFDAGGNWTGGKGEPYTEK